jgi:methylated-DNA-protein-cysteine methyltransferase related protein
MSGAEGYSAIYAVVRRIPRGRVATYGQVAAFAGRPGRARQVGYAMHALPEGSGVPWQRVINASGRISFHPDSMEHAVQRALLESEGVAFGPGGAVSLKRFGWKPRTKSGGKGR